MRLGSLVFAIILTPVLVGCQQKEPEISTLYRNSPLDKSRREHFASFDTSNHNDYNRGNCGMTARILNANVVASAEKIGKEPYPGIGFWCEPGQYKEVGLVPTRFDSAFPADSDSPFRW